MPWLKWGTWAGVTARCDREGTRERSRTNPFPDFIDLLCDFWEDEILSHFPCSCNCADLAALHFQGFSGNQTGEPWFELVLFIAGSGCENLRRKWLGLPRCI